MYVADLNDDLSVKDLQDMIDCDVLDGISTNGFCLLVEQKSVTQERSEEHPLNYYSNNANPEEWEKVLSNK